MLLFGSCPPPQKKPVYTLLSDIEMRPFRRQVSRQASLWLSFLYFCYNEAFLQRETGQLRRSISLEHWEASVVKEVRLLCWVLWKHHGYLLGLLASWGLVPTVLSRAPMATWECLSLPVSAKVTVLYGPWSLLGTDSSPVMAVIFSINLEN